MAMGEHPFLVTTTFQGDGTTIKYDATKPGRSDAVGKAFRFNELTGKGELVGDGVEIDGFVTEVDDDDKFTGAYMFGGLNFPLGTGATVKKGDKLVGALGPNSAKGYVKAAIVVEDTDDTVAKLRTATQGANKGRGRVVAFDSAHAQACFPG